ncbi:hypothetical protein FRC03_003376 [Tulasnella sp. 419]|nr:hypothetical protein FRC03_003376 [Tulasnella sp. 419]
MDGTKAAIWIDERASNWDMNQHTTRPTSHAEAFIDDGRAFVASTRCHVSKTYSCQKLVVEGVLGEREEKPPARTLYPFQIYIPQLRNSATPLSPISELYP